MLADTPADPDHTEAHGLVQGNARGVLGKDPGLDRPDARRLGRSDEGAQQLAADTQPASAGMHVDGVLDHPGVDTPPGYRGYGHPARDAAPGDGDVAVIGQPGRGEVRPGRGGGLERGVAL